MASHKMTYEEMAAALAATEAEAAAWKALAGQAEEWKQRHQDVIGVMSADADRATETREELEAEIASLKAKLVVTEARAQKAEAELRSEEDNHGTTSLELLKLSAYLHRTVGLPIVGEVRAEVRGHRDPILIPGLEPTAAQMKQAQEDMMKEAKNEFADFEAHTWGDGVWHELYWTYSGEGGIGVRYTLICDGSPHDADCLPKIVVAFIYDCDK